MAHPQGFERAGSPDRARADQNRFRRPALTLVPEQGPAAVAAGRLPRGSGVPACPRSSRWLVTTSAAATISGDRAVMIVLGELLHAWLNLTITDPLKRARFSAALVGG